MLEAIIDFINLKLELLNYFEKRHCLSTLVKTDTGMVYPAEYVSKGNYNAIDFDAFDGVSYIRLTNDISFDRIDNKYTPSPRLNITFPLRVVFSVRKDKLSADDAYSFDRVRASIAKQLESDPLDLTTQLKADNVVITTGDYIEDAKNLWDEETAETGQYQPKYEVVFGALEVTVTVTIKKECIPAECDNFESDILRTFDFCKPAIQDRLTPTQVACLEAWLVQCDDATVQLNGTTIGTIPSGDTESFDVLQNGSPVGSWNGSAWIIPPCPSSASLSIAVSSATPDYNGTVTITATPSGFSPTSYIFSISDAESGESTISQASNVLVWTVNKVGTVTISVTANDGISNAGDSTTITVVDPITYATRLADWNMNILPTLVDNRIDTIIDDSGNGHDLSALSSSDRWYYDELDKRADSVGRTGFRNATSNPLAGVADFTMFMRFQKRAADNVNQRVITFGVNGLPFGVVLFTASAGVNVLIGSNNYAQYTSIKADVQLGVHLAVVKNGTSQYDVYDNGSLATPVATSGNAPATINLSTGTWLGSTPSSFAFTGAIKRILIFDGVLTATQIAAVNARLNFLNP